MPLSPILVVHICGGSAGLLSGTLAVAVRKGSRAHRLAGNVFVVAMLTLAASGTLIAIGRSQAGNIIGGLLTFYMIATGWMTGWRKDGKTGTFDWVALVAGLCVAATCIIYGVKVERGLMSPRNGGIAGMDFFLGSTVLLAAAGDLRMLVRGGIVGRPRIARHLWRMCFGLFIATGSFFLGQQQVFPAFLQGSSFRMIPALFPLVLLVYWLVRIRFKNSYRLGASRAASGVESGVATGSSAQTLIT